MKDFDVGIIGAGVAGAFATLKLAKDHKNVKAILFDLGRPPMKRRRQLEGWLGCLPNSDGKLYQSDVGKVAELTGLRRAKSAHTWFRHVLEEIDDFKVIKDRSPSAAMEKKIKKLGYDISLNDHVQIYPKEIHALSKHMAEVIERGKNITFNFDSEVIRIAKQKNVFVISTDDQEYRCKKIIIAVGRSGWRWAKELYASFGIIDNNDIARFGIRVETNSSVMKDFNKSNCTLTKADLEIGPLSWFGTVIPEDHVDVAISAFRSNENRWKSDKVSFNLIGNRSFPDTGFEQTDRISKLTFVLANDRIIKERVSTILTGKSRISIIPEYDWLKEVITDLGNLIPEVTTKAYFHVPTIIPSAPKINIGDNLETEVDGMFVVGESAGIHGILSAGIMGIIAADAVCK
ncbi:MAG: FAD-dependent oxidoreductase [Thioploca sp.]|nr:FAD-dependent oxidoreductase [Thioploca sp.]